MKFVPDNTEKCILKAGLGFVFCVAMTLLSVPLAYSSGLSETRDCSSADVEAKINKELSVRENLDFLLKDLDKALRNVRHCEETNSDGSAGVGSNGASGAVSRGEGTAARGIAGTEGTSNGLAGSGSGPFEKEKKSSKSNSPVSSEAADAGKQGASSNGRRPDKLKKNDNDSIFVQQLKTAIREEKNPLARDTLLKELKKFEK